MLISKPLPNPTIQSLQSAVAFAFAVAFAVAVALALALALLVVIPEGDLLLFAAGCRSSSNQNPCHPALSVVEWVLTALGE
jgi:membrane protein DedA with SNARE-associated domain